MRPYLLRQRREFAIRRGITAQAWRADRADTSDDLCSRLEKRGDFPQSVQAHRLLVGQNQKTVGDTSRDDNAAVRGDFKPHKRIARANIPVVAIGQRRRPAGCRFRVAAAVRRILAAVEQAVRDRSALLQQKLAAGLVGYPVLRQRPPSLGTVEMHAPFAHCHARQILAVRPGLVDKAMVDNAVHAMRKDAVALRLYAERRLLPPPAFPARIRGKRFGRHIAPPPDVRQITRDARVADRPDTGAARAPEFPHGDVGGRAILKIVGRAASVRLQRKLESSFAAFFRKRAGIVFGEHVGHSPAEIRQKALRLLQGPHDIAREHGEIGEHVISAALCEFLLETLRPVLGTDFVAVDKYVVEAALHIARKRSEIIAQLADIGVEMKVQGRFGKLVHFQSHAKLGGRVVPHSVRRITKTHDLPLAWGNFPRQRTVFRHVRRQIDDSRLVHDLIRPRRDIFLHAHRCAHAERLRAQFTDRHFLLKDESVHFDFDSFVNFKPEAPYSRSDGSLERKEPKRRVGMP